MALWNASTGFLPVSIGTSPNDGTGDNIRNAFNKVDSALGNISSFLSAGAGSSSVDFVTSNITNINTTYGNITNLIGSSIGYSTGSLTGNLSVGNLVSNGTIVSSGSITSNGTLSVHGNIYAGGNVLPTASGAYDLGSSTTPFRNLYVQATIATSQLTQSSDAGILKIHANALVGDVQDTGILGNITSDYNGANTYAFFGHQYTTNNFVYKITNTDVTQGNSVVYDGFYGKAQFGSMLLSNNTVSTSSSTGALTVTGGVGIGGNLNVGGSGSVSNDLSVGGSLYAGGYPVITTGSVLGLTYNGAAALVTGTTVFGGNVQGTGAFKIQNGTQSVDTVTGALTVLGGIGAGGNINAGGFVGPFYGQVRNPAQTIFNDGSIASLHVSGTVYSAALQTGTISASQLVTLSQTGTSLSTTTGNISATGVGIGFIGNLYGSVLTPVQTNITSVGTLSTLAVSGNTTSGNVVASGFYFANGAPFVSSVFGNADVIGELQNLSTNIVSTANITAANITGANITAVKFIGSGAGLTNIPNSALTNYSITINGTSVNLGGSTTISTGTSAAGSLTGTTLSSNVVASSLTSVGTLSGLTVSGTASISTVTATTVSATTVSATTVSAATIGNTGATITGTVNTASQPNITTLAGLTSFGTAGVTTTAAGNFTVTGNLTVSGTTNTINNTVYETTEYVSTVDATTLRAVTIGNVGANHVGTGTYLTSLNASNLSSGTVPSAQVSGSYSGITAVGTLTGLTVSGAIVPSANTSINLGSTSAWWGSIYGTAVHAQYADLAEMYTSDAEYLPGTVLIFGGTAEVTVTTEVADTRVAGAVSTNPAYLMNSDTHGVALALRGRVPVRVVGPVAKGDVLITSTHTGCAQSGGRNGQLGAAVFAKALETSDEPGEKIIEAVIL